MKTKNYLIAIAIIGGLMFTAFNTSKTLASQNGEQTARVDRKAKPILAYAKVDRKAKPILAYAKVDRKAKPILAYAKVDRKAKPILA